MLLALVFSYCFNQRSVAAPIADVQSIEDISPSCTELSGCRTLLNICSSCLATIVACAWTAVHPDIPPYGEDPWWQTFRRIAFTVSALIAPDIYLLIAAFQYFNARKIAQVDVLKEHSWDITHGFFVLMGGFALCKSLERDTKQLGAAELCTLIENRKLDFPHISEQEIQDRSKADWVSKTIASMQIFWFMLQVLARLVNKLSVTELEVLTVGFTVMANAVYAFWLKKPFCVNVPIILHERPDAPRIASDVSTSVRKRKEDVQMLSEVLTKMRRMDWIRPD